MLARTLTAAAVGGTVAAISGGSFANGAISAAFTHLFNDELKRIHMKISLYDSKDRGNLAGNAGGKEFTTAAKLMGGRMIDMASAGWKDEFSGILHSYSSHNNLNWEILVFDHGVQGEQQFGNEWIQNSANPIWKIILGTTYISKLTLMGCHVGAVNPDNGDDKALRDFGGLARLYKTQIQVSRSDYWYGWDPKKHSYLNNISSPHKNNYTFTPKPSIRTFP